MYTARRNFVARCDREKKKEERREKRATALNRSNVATVDVASAPK